MCLHTQSFSLFVYIWHAVGTELDCTNMAFLNGTNYIIDIKVTFVLIAVLRQVSSEA